MQIEIVTCKNDTLKETGFGPHKACLSVKAALNKLGHESVVTVCSSQSDLNSIVKRRPEIVVLGMKYVSLENGELIWLSDFFDAQKISYTGSPKDTLGYDSDKVSAKRRVATHGIATASFFLTGPNEFETETELPLPFPLFVKPLGAANGNGVDRASIVHSFDQFTYKVGFLFAEYQMPVLVEEFLTGKEFTVAVIESNG